MASAVLVLLLAAMIIDIDLSSNSSQAYPTVQPRLPDLGSVSVVFETKESAATEGCTEGYLRLSPMNLCGWAENGLQAIFVADQEQPFAAEYDHPYLEDLRAIDMYEDVPLFDESRWLFAASEADTSVTYIATDEQDRVVGMARIGVSVSAFTPLAQSMQINLEEVYTRKLFRGQGVNTALLHALAKVVILQVQSIASEMRPSYLLTGVPLVIQMESVTDWTSKAGKIAGHQFEDVLRFELDSLRTDSKDCEVFESVLLQLK